MNFLYPGFLFALFTVAIPVIIHLFNFRRFKKVYFSNVAFLKEVKEQNATKEKLKNLLILACRILAIVCLVFAFARPFLPTTRKIDRNKGNVVSIYVDNSYSMDAVNKEGSLLDEAKRKAKEIVKSFQLNDRFQLLTNDFEGRHQRLLSSDELLQAIDDVKISAANRTMQQVVNRQQGVFNGSSNQFAYLISDFQQGFVGKAVVKTDAQTNVALIKVKANDLPNIAVDSAWLLSPVHQAGNTEKLVVQLRNYGDEDATNVPVKLSINGQQKAISSLTIKAGQVQKDTLSYSGLTNGWQKATLTIKDFPLTFDDELRFSFNVSTSQHVLSINGPQSTPYIKALFAADSYFKLTEMPEANISYSMLPNFNVVILNGLQNPSSGLAQELNAYINNGGTVVLFPNLDVDPAVYSKFLTTLRLPAVAELRKTPTKVNAIELKHPLFSDVFESLPQRLDLPVVNRYFKFSTGSTKSQEQIMQLQGGALFFGRFPIGSGQVYLSATALADADGNLAKHPVFVPLMFKIAFESSKQQPIYYIATQDQVLESEKIALAANQSLKLVGDQFEVIPELSQRNGKTLLYLADQVKKSGFYELKKGDARLSVVAFNDSRRESDMHYATPDDLKKLFGERKITVLDPRKDSVASALGEKNNGTELWKLCLILALIFLALEIVLIRYYHIQKKTIHEPVS